MLDQTLLQLGMEGIREKEEGKRGGERGDFSRVAIILNIVVYRGRLIEGQLLFEETDSRSAFRLNYEYLKEYEIE